MRKRLTARQKRAITALIYCTNVREAARESEIPYSTLRNWLSCDSVFKTALSRELEKITSDADISITAGFSEAVQTLREISVDGQSDGARIAAAKALVDTKFRLMNACADVSRNPIIVIDL